MSFLRKILFSRVGSLPDAAGARPFGSSIGRVAVPASRGLSAQEWKRRAWHFFPGLLAFAVTQIPHDDPLVFWRLMVFLCLGAAPMVWGAIRFHSSYRRHDQEHALPVALGYALPLLVLLTLCPAHLELTLAATAILAFGDGSATLFGMQLGGPTLPWNGSKTVAGTLAFVICGALTASGVYWLEANPAVPYAAALALVLPVVLACALAESLLDRWTDNGILSSLAAVLLVLMQSLVVGWAG